MIFPGGTAGDIPHTTHISTEVLHAEASEHQHSFAGVPSPAGPAPARPRRWVRRAERLEWRERAVVGDSQLNTSPSFQTNMKDAKQFHTVSLSPITTVLLLIIIRVTR